VETHPAHEHVVAAQAALDMQSIAVMNRIHLGVLFGMHIRMHNRSRFGGQNGILLQ
jgi:hypothetical protein